MGLRAGARAAIIAGAAIGACKFAPATQDGGPIIDAMPDAIPDAGPCVNLNETTCAGDTLRTCTTVGVVPAEQQCNWGCLPQAVAHCGHIVPSGGGVVATDLTMLDPALADITFDDLLIVDGTDGKIGLSGTPSSVRAAGTGVSANGIGYKVHNGVAIFTFKSLHVTQSLALVGSHAIAFVADGVIDVGAPINASGFCGTTTPGPGGFLGGDNQGNDAVGSGRGTGNNANNKAGGGGAYAGSGGDGGNNANSGGSVFGGSTINPLAGGGGGGGGGGGPMSGAGGGGGGALQLVSNTQVTISMAGALSGINAGGCGGGNGVGGNDAGGGGGAGGAILLEARVVSVFGTLAVNGGGGGGGNAAAGSGASGPFGRTQATGGGVTTPGGNGGYINVRTGLVGSTGNGKGGGGGGGIGRIRIDTRSGAATIDPAAVLSPSLSDSPTSCSQGVSVIQ